MEMDQIDDMLDALDQTRSEGEDTCFDQAAVDAWFAANGPEMLAAMRRDRAELERVRADRDEARRFHSALHYVTNTDARWTPSMPIAPRWGRCVL
jgi:hypothetical protein